MRQGCSGVSDGMAFGVTLALPNRFQFLKGGTALGASCT